MSKARTLANLISDNAELADGQISVAEVVGAAPTANPSFTGNITVSGNVDGRDIAADGTKLDGVEASADVTDATNVTAAGALMDSELTNIAAIKALNQGVATTDEVAFDNTSLNAIAKDISDTAVDVFVYDTSKDSDGGAWRKRTQHTSWYNETLNTATRGSRKEFPAVAVIVAESNQVTIYDGDDPDLPMWMVFNQAGAIGSASNIITANSSVTSLACVNGTMCFGMNDSSNPEGTFTVNFVSELSRCYRTVGSGYTGSIYTGSVSTRNSNKSYEGDYDLLAIVSQNINDVAMTVLPNAPIDSVTGLPVPTIAVATDGGVSVIKDDGTVVDITHIASTNNGATDISFNGNQISYATQQSGSSTNYWRKAFIDIPSADVTGSYTNNISGITVYDARGTSSNSGVALNTNSNLGDATNNIKAAVHDKAVGFTNKLTLLDTASLSGSMVAYTTSDYATGWMNGDIKLATLSDTDDTDVTGSELVTNGTFDSNTSGWTSQYATLSVASGKMRVTNTATNGSGLYYWTAEVGKKYVLTANFDIGTAGGGQLRVWESLDGTIVSTAGIGSSGTYTLTFTATQSSLIIRCMTLGNSGTYSDWDNVSLRLAEEDRSVNGNGLQVFGTVTKNPVATGADLVAYSGWTAGNYLQQPYNSDLDFGTGDFSYTTWFKSTAAGGAQYWYKRGENTGGSAGMTIWTAADLQYVALYINGSGISTPSGIYTLGVWNQLVITRRNGVLTFYINGVSKHSANNTASVPTGMDTQVGYNATTSTLSLIRISATAPSPEQIKKVYEDEKHLFQENAKATLYGSSDAVTALAHDDTTDLLHVGTSAGRSVFQGLRRVENTTTAVGATISASNGLVAED